MTERLTWYGVCRSIREIIRTDSDTSNVDLGDPDTWDEYAHEWADGSEWVIYYAKSRELWAESSYVQAWEEEASHLAVGTGIGEQITACVYLAVRQEIMDALQEIAEERNLVA